ncbi:MAG: peptidoglycan DD-metalloendopeptidase family protein [Chloroflexi bacterium]|nr:peptidoglycan DD-metalloendopeptidase family protein [Chloroflexota bacterium]
MAKKTTVITIVIQSICWSVIGWLIFKNSLTPANALLQVPTPRPFLGPVYYNQEDIWQVFDHNLPCASVCDDGNVHVVHHDGSQHYPVTPVPSGEPYIPGGYGYDQHAGIDYSLKYEPVLAAANGIVEEANWYNPSNHRASYGLYVILDHTPETNYETWYGHLSVLTVQAGDEITIDSNDPGNRNRILGISGNTGAVLGNCGTVPDDPNCAQHLHFEIRLSNQGYKPVNPYGWVAPTETVDPWSVYVNPSGTPAGAVSYNLWATPPALVSYADQYPGTNVPPVPEPAVNNPRMIIDDRSADFVSAYAGGIDPSSSTIDPAYPECWQPVSDSAAYNLAYRRVPVSATGIPTCGAFWYVRPDAFTPPGDYDVFVHVPPGDDQTLGAAYTIRHNGQTHTAIVVQAAYPNNEYEHGPWAYIGRYDFAMQPGVTEYVRLTNATTVSETSPNAHVVADAIMLAPAEFTSPPGDEIYVSFAGSGTAGNIPYADEDILAYNAVTGEWSLLFDGSDVGLAASNVDDFDFREGDIYYSLTRLGSGIGGNFTQLYRFSPTSLGTDTAGTIREFFAHSQLDKPAGDVDAFSFGPDGRYLLRACKRISSCTVSLITRGKCGK